jgi:transposase
LNIGEAVTALPQARFETQPTWAVVLGKVERTMMRPRENQPVVSKGQIGGLPMVRWNVGGIDLGSERHWVCAPSVDGKVREVASFGATTPELIRMAVWLKERNVVSVAMESTGVYWIAPFEILEAQGMEVVLVDTRQLARVPGRDKKTDPSDCEWLQRLHSCGLLRGCFRPEEEICMLRTLVRDKANLVSERSDWVRRMQKSLDQMNVRVHRAVSDLDGATGMAILRAIVAGERDAAKLAQLRDARCKKTEEQIAEELSGHWREDHLFSLKQSLRMYEAIEQRIADYEREILRRLDEMQREEFRDQTPPPVKNPQKAKAIRKRGEEPMRGALYRLNGADLTAIDAIGVETIHVVISEYGTDLSRFETEKQFVQHIRLAPYRPMTGGKPIKKRRPNTASTRVAAALRMAALSSRHTMTALGAYYRKVASRKDGGVAVFATARRLAILIYRLIRWGQPYVDEGAEAFEKRHKENSIRSLHAKAKGLGLQLVPTPSAT